MMDNSEGQTGKGYNSEDENPSNSSKDDEIRSTAIVKKSQFEFPVSFRELQSNTDLKTPPSNWLRGNFSVRIPNSTIKRSDFTSFLMGYQFPDCIGEVDIVSDAENIKKLLKMAYQPNTHLSMMVHRVGKTLLIDEFDIYTYLLMQTENQWKWLKKFFYHHVLQSLSLKENNVLVKPDKSRVMVQSKNLLSKFWYYSIGEENIPTPTSGPERVGQSRNSNKPMTAISPTKDPSFELPVEEYFPDPPTQSFTRNVIWKFEDLCMLIGTDLPIFGGRSHPCVSLRLRDMDKPISILTGIDYWLDNLMCNVPEVVMCYHQNGIVQKYELVKTEDLPQMRGSEFSPQFITDIAHNILSFLKSKATKEGHTYWLFKGKDDDIVKLYDLTSLAEDREISQSFKHENKNSSTETNVDDSGESSEGDLNPFTIPVAMLLYHVAKNIWYSKEDLEDGLPASSNHSTVRNLLQHSIELLSNEKREKYQKICIHSHVISAEVFLPQDFDPENPNLSDVKPDELEMSKSDISFDASESSSHVGSSHTDKCSASSSCYSLSYSSLCRKKAKRNKHKISTEPPPMLSSNVFVRCNEAMKHVIAGLRSLSPQMPESTPEEGEADDGGETTESHFTEHEERQTFAKPFVPIPMPYSSLDQTQISCEKDNNFDQTQISREKDKEFAASFNANKNSDIGSNASSFEASRCINEASGSQNREPSHEDKNKASLKKDKCEASLNKNSRKASYSENSKETSLSNPSALDSVNDEALDCAVPRTPLTQATIQARLKNASFSLKMKFQLLRKASLVYMTKSRIELNENKFGFCLRYAKLSLRAWCSLLNILGSSLEFTLPVLPLLLSGDAYYNLSKSWTNAPSHIEDFNTLNEEILQMNEIFDQIGGEVDFSSAIKVPCDQMEAMTFSHRVFELAVQNSSRPETDLLRRLASICNELGCMIMNEADQSCCDSENDARASWERSWRFLERASEIFRAVDDNINLALLHCNKGRYLRLFAFHHSSPDTNAIMPRFIKEKYEKAFQEYEIALGLLNPEAFASVSESIRWEFSSALFGYGTIIQDTLSDVFDEDENIKYLSNIYNKCLKYCDLKSPSRSLVYQYRAGVVHSRLAAVYHDKYRRNHDSKFMYLSELHYRKSASLFLTLDSSLSDIIKVHLDHASLLEDVLECTKNNLAKWKHLINILDLLSRCENALNSEEHCEEPITDANQSDKDETTQVVEEGVNGEREVVSDLLRTFEKKLSNSLMSLLKLSKITNKSTKVYEESVKKMYLASLNKEKKCLKTHLTEALVIIKPYLREMVETFQQ